MSIESVMPSNHLILCHPLLLPPSIFPSIRVFPNESVVHIRWPEYWSFTFNISSSNEYSRLISFRMDWLDLLAVFSRVFSNTTVQKQQFFSAQLSSHYTIGNQDGLTVLEILEESYTGKECSDKHLFNAHRFTFTALWSTQLRVCSCGI